MSDSNAASAPSSPAQGRTLLDCDVIFRGGITSGVIYPGTVAGLAKRYRFRQIGGASAGAIAAGIAAAGEYGRQFGGKETAFDTVADLATEISGGEHAKTNLATLFRAQPALWLLDRLIWQGFRFGLWAPVTLFFVPGLIVAAIAWFWGGNLSLMANGFTLGVLASALALGWQIFVTLPRSGFGLCAGTSPSIQQSDERMRQDGALMDWIHATVQRLAGRTVGETLFASKGADGAAPSKARPITMGDLWGTSDDAAARNIDLVLTTTNISQQLPHQFPFLRRTGIELYFRPEELARVLPKDVADWMVIAAQPATPAFPERKGYLRLPAPADLPIIFGVRLSLSFPGLIAAVPLYAEDHTQTLREKRRVRPGQAELRRCWFSDGGITSNFPIHLFDAPLPSRPTFCVDLRDATVSNAEALRAEQSRAAPEPKMDADDEEQAAAIGDDPLIWMPRSNSDDIAPRFGASFEGSLPGFLGAIVQTARNGQENELMLMPGHRDRIVHIETTREEGGLNLHMGAEMIEGLSRRGGHAADLLRARFDPEGEASRDGFVLNWPNHRWIRFRSTMAAIERLLADFAASWANDSQGNYSFPEIVAKWEPASDKGKKAGHRATPSYPWANAEVAEAARRVTSAILELARKVEGEAQDLQRRDQESTSVFDGATRTDGRRHRGAPRPKLGLKARPLGDDPRRTEAYPPRAP